MKILLVRLRLIGDVVFTTPLIAGLQRRFPDAHLTYVVEPAAAPIVSGSPHLSHVLIAPRSRGLARLKDDALLAATLRRERFDVAIDLHGGPRSRWLTWASRAPMRIGYRTRGRTWMYTHAVERTADNAPRHSVQNQWDLLTPLGVGVCTPETCPVEMAEDAAAARRIDDELRHAGVEEANRLVVLHVSAGNPFRRWPPEAFVETIDRLIRTDPQRRIVVTSGPSDVALAARISSDARSQLGALGVALPPWPDTNLHELQALIARASLYIGGDSGPLHIAATTATPVVALLGPTLPERSLPWRSPAMFAEGVDGGPLPCRPCRQRVCAPGDFRCLTAITPSMVVAAAERALAVSATSRRVGRETLP